MTALNRRQMLGTLAGASTLAIPGIVRAQEKDIINFVSAFPPGSGADVLVRFWAQKLQPITGTTIVVQNKPGAMGFIAAEYEARTKPDGNTIFVHAGSSIAGNMHVFKHPPFDVTKDLKVATTLSRHSYIMVVGKNSPYKTLQDVTAAVKPKGEKASYGTSNTSSFLIGELYKQKTGVKTLNVNYRTSADFINDLNSGAIDYAIADAIAAIGVARQGNWRMVAIGSGERMTAVPDLPTFAESGAPGIDIVSWWGALVPTAMPQPIVDKIHGWFGEALKQPETAAFLKQQGNDVYIAPPDVAASLLTKTAAQWKDYVRIAKIEKI